MKTANTVRKGHNCLAFLVTHITVLAVCIMTICINGILLSHHHPLDCGRYIITL